ncbi:MAG: hypothetical protein LBD99_04260 [Candidatus Margulisbacteria bacterium]|jgi:hypothetical protein|nr:hypothetical protein [Candidatus Margulisiibacteriota bacterium]
MAKKKPEKDSAAYSAAGSAMGPISSAGLGMSPVERVQYIREMQRASPVQKIAGALQEVKWEGFGLLGSLFSKGAAAARGVHDAYAQIRQSRGDHSLNQHIEGLTENVRGLERLRHEIDPQTNVDLLDTQQLPKTSSFYVEPDWAPKPKGKIE